jgi:lysozyme
MKSLNNKGYKLITDFEGLSLKPYLCSAKVPTIGYGNTYYKDGTKVTLKDKPITKVQAFDLFKDIADNFAKAVSKNVITNVNQNQFNSLVSFCFNIGITNFKKSTLLRLVNINPNDANIAKEFLKWNKAGGVIINGLTKRRIAESSNYFTNDK